MKTGKITAKLRNAVPVCLMIEGKEVKRYKSIDLPDMLKEVEMLDFHFSVPEDGKITFEISYAPGVLPEVFPGPRTKMLRAEKAPARAAAKAAAEQEATAEENAPEAPQKVTALVEVKPFDIAALIAPPTTEDTAPEAESGKEDTSEQAAEKAGDGEAGRMEIHYNVTGPRRKFQLYRNQWPEKMPFNRIPHHDTPPAQGSQPSDRAGLYEVLLHGRAGRIRRNQAVPL